MSRPQVFVRRVDPAHHDLLADLWRDGRLEAAGEAPHRGGAEGPLESLLQREDVVVLIASPTQLAADDGTDGDPVGYVILQDGEGGLFADTPTTTIEQLYIAPAWRRHGVARQLLAAAAAHAGRVGSVSVVSSVPSQARDANRFFARLGFSPTVVRRVTTPAALHRRLAAASEGTAPASPAGVYSKAAAGFEILHRRRTARVRAVRQSGTL